MLDPENILKVCSLKPDFVGYIFFAGSKRYVGNRPDPAIFRIPDQVTSKVGVFVNEDTSLVRKLYDKYGLDFVQLHGTESPQYCQALKNTGIQVIKAINPYSVVEGESLDEYKESVYCFLFDTPGKTHGGTGRKFDWDLLNGLSVPQPFLLSGGIGPTDIMSVREIGHPTLMGIDVNSRFEIQPGKKDVVLLGDFIRKFRAERY